MKTRKKASIPALKRKLWKLVSPVVRRVYADTFGMVACVCCGSVFHWKEIDAGHFIPKARGAAVYFDWFNLHPQCSYCNRFDNERGKILYTLWMRETYGQAEIDRLMAASHTAQKWSRTWLEDQIEHFKQCNDEMNN